MKIKTALTRITEEGDEIIHGKKLEELIFEKSFSEAIFFLLLKKEPTKNELRMWNALLVSAIDHGAGTASALTARISASSRNSMHTSLAAGLLGLGERHGLAISSAMKFFQENCEEKELGVLLKTMKEQKKYAPGFGHKVLTVDMRVQTLFNIAKETGFFGAYSEFALRVEKELNAISSKRLPMNIDGGMAALLCDMKVPIHLAEGIFMIARVPGLVAHVAEQHLSEDGLLRLDESEIEYI